MSNLDPNLYTKKGTLRKRKPKKSRNYFLNYSHRITSQLGKYSIHPIYASIYAAIALIVSFSFIKKKKYLYLFITGDSGPMHLAAAFQVPTVAIFGPTKDNETSQWMNEKSTIVKMHLECQPCMKRTCPLKHHNCMRQVQASDVIGAVNRLN